MKEKKTLLLLSGALLALLLAATGARLGIGNMSPPFGIVLYQVIGLMGLRFSEVCKAIIPFLIIMLIVLAVIATCPGLILYIPNLLYG